ncbi:MAG: D-cysteine desulfhydrase family protein [Nitrososphaerota archaeon]
MKLEEIPRIRLGFYPTLLHEMPRLSRMLGGPRIFIKRDDLTGLAFGGNKTRIIEYIFADAKNVGADIIVASCGVQSNWARQITAAAKILGMKPVLILRTAQFGEKPKEYDGNLLLDKLMGADVRIVKAPISADVSKEMAEVANEYAAKGHRPYILYSEPPIGVFGYVNCAYELVQQAMEQGIKIDYIVHASSGGATQAGLILGMKMQGLKTRIIGISAASRPKPVLVNDIKRLIDGAAKILGLDINLSDGDVFVSDDYELGGYGAPSNDIFNTIRTVAELEGIILDPVYTGKAMTGLIDLIKKGYFSRDEAVVFLHTGGLPALFAYRGFFGSP